MDESQKRGLTSSPAKMPTRSHRSSIDLLTHISNSETVKKIISAFGEKSSLHLVGGTVRDAFSGYDPTDLDLASSLSSNEMVERCEAADIRVIPTGLKHGTVTCVINEQNIEITTFRAGRGTGETIEEDLAGRDFTINATAFSVTSYQLIDPYHGVEDLNRNILKAVEDPKKRFEEDPLRILRMVRFGTAAGRTIESNTFAAAQNLVSNLKSVSVERIRSELEKILMSDRPAEGVRELHRLGALPFTWPELIPTIGFEQNKFHIHDVFEHTLDVLSKCPYDRLLRLTALYHDIGKAHTLSIDADGNRHFYDHEKVSADICKESMTRLRFSHDDVDAVSNLVKLHMRPFDCGPSGVRRLLRDSGEYFPQWRAFKEADTPGVFDEKLLAEQKLRFDEMVHIEKNRTVGSIYSKLAINGDDLIVLGMKPGRAIGNIIKNLHEEVLEFPDRNDREYLLTRARELIQDQ